MLDDGIVRSMQRPRCESRFLLIVDSNAQSLSYTSMLLQRFNYQVFKAGSGREALDTTATALPFLILMSLQLPDMHGFDLMQQFKEDSKASAIPLIALSSQDDLRVKQHCFDLGAVDCLSLPLSAELLYRTVQLAAEKNPRATMRIRPDSQVTVTAASIEGLHNASAVELSERGLFLKTTRPPVRDMRLSLQLTVDGRTIPAEASVLYNRTAGSGPYQEQGIGLQFVRIAPQDQEHIRRFIRNEVMRDLAPRAM